MIVKYFETEFWIYLKISYLATKSSRYRSKPLIKQLYFIVKYDVFLRFYS